MINVFDYAMLIRLLESHISNKSDKILYVFDTRCSARAYKKRNEKQENIILLSIQDIWNTNALDGRRYKEYKFIK